MSETEDTCGRCYTRREGLPPNDAADEHTCPYQREINDDDEFLTCNCCDECTQECIWDI
jgi:hypothetical protein